MLWEMIDVISIGWRPLTLDGGLDVEQASRRIVALTESSDDDPSARPSQPMQARLDSRAISAPIG